MCHSANKDKISLLQLVGNSCCHLSTSSIIVYKIQMEVHLSHVLFQLKVVELLQSDPLTGGQSQAKSSFDKSLCKSSIQLTSHCPSPNKSISKLKAIILISLGSEVKFPSTDFKCNFFFCSLSFCSKFEKEHPSLSKR